MQSVKSLHFVITEKIETKHFTYNYYVNNVLAFVKQEIGDVGHEIGIHGMAPWYDDLCY